MHSRTVSIPFSRTPRASAGLAELLIWVYRDQRADIMTGRGLHVPDPASDEAKLSLEMRTSACGCAALEAISLLGSRIKTTGWLQRPSLHPDAERLHDALVDMSLEDWLGAALLFRFAVAGELPDYGDGAQELGPMFDARDRIIQDRYVETVELVDCVGRVSLVPLRYCPIEAYPSNDWIELSRAEYRQWHKALSRLWDYVQDLRLSKWRLEGVGAEAEPWLSDKKNK